MWKQLSTVSALAAILAATPALAQQSPSEKSGAPTATQQPQSGAAPSGQDAGQAGQDAAQKSDKGAQTGDLAGQSVYSSDGEELGEVTKVNRGSNGDIESIHVDIGSFLGMGGKTVEVSADQFTQANGRIELSLNAKEAQALPEVKAEKPE